MLKTPESISMNIIKTFSLAMKFFLFLIQHVNIFKIDLCQLFSQMKELVFPDIHGEIHDEKLESYHSMVQTLFPYGRIHIEPFRFRRWL
jgi:hypothetical protein